MNKPMVEELVELLRQRADRHARDGGLANTPGPVQQQYRVMRNETMECIKLVEEWAAQYYIWEEEDPSFATMQDDAAPHEHPAFEPDNCPACGTEFKFPTTPLFPG